MKQLNAVGLGAGVQGERIQTRRVPPFGNEYGSLGASGLAGLAVSYASPTQAQSYSASNVLQQTHYNQGLQQSHPSSGDLMNPLPSKR